MIDLLVQARGAGRYDHGGALAAAGRVDEGVLDRLLSHGYFAAPPPKSLDRHDFPLSALDGLALEDAAATLVAFTARRGGARLRPCPRAAGRLIVAGGGRHNPQIMRVLAERLPVRVLPADDLGWRGDAIEAEAFAYLAARTARGLPISFPGTTGGRGADDRRPDRAAPRPDPGSRGPAACGAPPRPSGCAAPRPGRRPGGGCPSARARATNRSSPASRGRSPRRARRGERPATETAGSAGSAAGRRRARPRPSARPGRTSGRRSGRWRRRAVRRPRAIRRMAVSATSGR